MGFYAKLPFAIAPGMGLNAVVAFSIVKASGGAVTWQTAMGAVFVSGIIFILLSIFKIREKIVNAIPLSLRYGVAVGIGIFLAMIGLKGAGFIVDDPETLVRFGGLTPTVVIFIFGLLTTGFLLVKKIRGALVFGMVGTAIISGIVSPILIQAGQKGIVILPKSLFALPSLEVFFKLDIIGALSLGMVINIFTLLFTDMFDSISTFVGVSEVGGFIDKNNGQPENVGKALLVDAGATTISGLFGTSSGTTYIESAAGVEEGGRTGFTAVITGLLFLPFIFLSPLLSFIPEVATAPVLVLVGLFMMRPIAKIQWNEIEEALPAFLAFILIPLSYNITQGIVWGFISYTAIKMFLGKFKDISITLWIITAFALLSLVLPFIKIS
jgi:AGZA family xanthine/uracil permease-like MFS transporter